jgi:hypothetical protein
LFDEFGSFKTFYGSINFDTGCFLPPINSPSLKRKGVVALFLKALIQMAVFFDIAARTPKPQGGLK